MESLSDDCLLEILRFLSRKELANPCAVFARGTSPSLAGSDAGGYNYLDSELFDLSDLRQGC
jgi:hypothetical protein